MKRNREQSMQRAVVKCTAAGIGCLIVLLAAPSTLAFVPSSSLRAATPSRHSLHGQAGRIFPAVPPPLSSPLQVAGEKSPPSAQGDGATLIKPTNNKASSRETVRAPDGTSTKQISLSVALSYLRSIFKATLIGANYALRSSWWCFPFLLSLFPLYCLAVLGSPARSPAWWSMPTMTAVMQSPSAEVIVGGFLLSNISYFLSGLYLLDVVPSISWRWNKTKVDGGVVVDKPRGPKFSDAPLLGTLTILCGICSVLYHTFQTIGPHDFAESFYYIDHGFAISSILYFLRLCGLPGKKTMALGGAGLVMLATGSLRGAEAYAWIHSLWHFLSAGASVSWAHDGVKKGGFLGIPPEVAESGSEFAA